MQREQERRLFCCVSDRRAVFGVSRSGSVVPSATQGCLDHWKDSRPSGVSVSML